MRQVICRSLVNMVAEQGRSMAVTEMVEVASRGCDVELAEIVTGDAESKAAEDARAACAGDTKMAEKACEMARVADDLRSVD